MEATTQQEHLDTLLQFTSTRRLKRSLQCSLFSYLPEMDDKFIPNDFKAVVEDHFYLMQMLEKLAEPEK